MLSGNITEKNLQKAHPDDFEKIMGLPGQSLAEKYFIYINGPHKGCEYCGAPTRFLSFNKGYKKYCSRKCACNDPGRLQRIAETCIRKYGTTNISSLESVKQKKIESSRKKYGCDYPTQADTIRQQISVTHSTKTVSERQASTDKRKQSCLERYGTEYAAQSQEVQDRMKATCMERYGVEHVFQSEEVISKINKTLLERYGGTGTQVFGDKIKATMIERYGAEYSKTDEFRELMRKLHNAGRFDHIYIKRCNTNMDRYNEPYYHHALAKQHHPEILSIDENNYWICKCPHPECNQCIEKTYITYGEVHDMRIKQGSELCTHLLPIAVQGTPSSSELTVRGWLDDLNIAYDSNRRDIIAPKELDIYLVKYNIAIEINGCYWHSTNEKPRNYHVDKYNRCFNAGIKLITLWEDWIQDEPDACRNLILYHLGLIELPELPWDPNLVDLGLGSGPIKEHKTEHGGFECWDAGVFASQQ